MKIIEIGTGYTSIPAKIGAATEIVIENLLREWGEQNVDLELIDVSFDGVKHNKSYNYKRNEIKLHSFFCKNKDKSFFHILKRIVYSVKLGFFIKKHLSRNQENIILHFHNQFNFVLTLLIANKIYRKSNIKWVYTVHTPGWPFFKKIPKSLFLEKYSILKADMVISLTKNIKSKLIDLVGKNIEDKIVVIPNGVSREIYHPLENLKKENIILNIGSICERKNQLGSIIALKVFLTSNNYKFVFAGKIVDIAYYEKIKEYLKENNLETKVQYIGEVSPGEELNLLYNKSKIYLSHSLQEAFISLVVLESMSSGLPVLLSNSFKNFIDTNNPINKALLIVEDDVMQTEIEKLLNDDGIKQELISKQINCIDEYFTWNQISKKSIEKFHKLYK